METMELIVSAIFENKACLRSHQASMELLKIILLLKERNNICMAQSTKSIPFPNMFRLAFRNKGDISIGLKTTKWCLIEYFSVVSC